MSTFNHSLRRTIKPTSALTRAELAARVQTLRHTLDVLADQAAIDGGEAFACLGSMKVALVTYEGLLRSKDRAALLEEQQRAGVPSVWQQAVGDGR